MYNESKIEWTTYNSHDAEKCLEDAFVDFINPTDSSTPAKVTTTAGPRSKYFASNLMETWNVSIPINFRETNIKDFSIKVNSILEEINACIGKVNTVLNVGHSVAFVPGWDNKPMSAIKVTIWSNEK